MTHKMPLSITKASKVKTGNKVLGEDMRNWSTHTVGRVFSWQHTLKTEQTAPPQAHVYIKPENCVCMYMRKHMEER